ncbi:hypothetical protein HJFPF1_07282 [Paramyrothecium foliicola]|nr:hypothetical protein HJFPF1_07282 [Paramyrothecium foliicola]
MEQYVRIYKGFWLGLLDDIPNWEKFSKTSIVRVAAPRVAPFPCRDSDLESSVEKASLASGTFEDKTFSITASLAGSINDFKKWESWAG